MMRSSSSCGRSKSGVPWPRSRGHETGSVALSRHAHDKRGHGTRLPQQERTRSGIRLLFVGLITWWCVGAWSGLPASAQRIESAPAELEGVGVTEHLDVQIPLDLPFVDSDGSPVRLGSYFDGTRPVILTMNYSNCPMLCSLQLNGLFQGLERLDWDIGGNFQMITVSIDPKETPQRAALTKQKYLKAYGRPGVARGWHCLTGRQENIRKLADVVGFGYEQIPGTEDYAHAAVAMICTPDGRVSRYLYGIEYPAQTVRFALLEAAEGRIGSTVDQVLLFCFQYDPEKGRYGPAAVRIMQAGGVLTVLVFGGVLAVFWRREVRKPKKPRSDSA